MGFIDFPVVVMDVMFGSRSFLVTRYFLYICISAFSPVYWVYKLDKLNFQTIKNLFHWLLFSVHSLMISQQFWFSNEKEKGQRFMHFRDERFIHGYCGFILQHTAAEIYRKIHKSYSTYAFEDLSLEFCYWTFLKETPYHILAILYSRQYEDI